MIRTKLSGCLVAFALLLAACAAPPPTPVPATAVAAVTVAPSPTPATSFVATRLPTGAPTATATMMPTILSTATDAPTMTRTGTRPPTRRPTRVPTATPVPPTAPAIAPNWQPPYPDGWFHTVHYTPADVAPGQPYWRLVSALFCDVPSKEHPHQETCPDYPGGMLDHTVYVAVLDENGNCFEGPNVLHQINTGDMIPLTTKHQTWPWTTCATDYEWSMYGEGSTFWVDGLPSDRIGELVLNSPQLNWSENRAHVRYFLVFQKSVR